MAEALNPDWAEDKRRKAVQAIAQSGSMSGQIRDESAAVSTDYADAAAAAFATNQAKVQAPPVVLEQAAADYAAAAQQGTQAAADTHDIFARGRDRNMASEHERYDLMPVLAEAFNTQLGRYDKSLADQQAAQASARARSYRSGGGGSSSWGGGGSTSTDTGSEDINMMGAVFEVFGPATSQIITDSIAAGASQAEAMAAMEATLRENGVSDSLIAEWLEGFAHTWQTAYDKANEPQNEGNSLWRDERWR
jgi:hypothetical protein